MRFGDSRLSAVEFGGGQDRTEPGGRFCGGLGTHHDAQEEAGWPHIPRGPFCTPSRGHGTWGGGRVLASPLRGGQHAGGNEGDRRALGWSDFWMVLIASL